MTRGIEAPLEELLALRSQATHIDFNEPKFSHSRVTGQVHARFRGRGMDYFESRPYVEGDDVRHIDWRVTGRSGQLHSKVYVEERDRPVLIVVDFSPSMYFGTRNALKSVVAARLAALLAWFASHKRDRVGGLLFTPEAEHEIRPRSGRRAVLTLLNALSEASKLHHKAKGENLLERALEHTAQVARPGSQILLISDFYEVNDSLRQPLNRLAASNNLVTFFISDPFEQALPKNRRIPLTNGERRMRLRARDEKERTRLKAHFEHRASWLAREMSLLGQPVVPVSTMDTLSEIFSKPPVVWQNV